MRNPETSQPSPCSGLHDKLAHVACQSRPIHQETLVNSYRGSAWRYLTVRFVGAGRALLPPVVPPLPVVVPPLPPVVPPLPLVVPPLPLKAASRRPKFTPGS